MNSLNKSAPAHANRGSPFLYQLLELLLQIGSHFIHILQEFFFLDDRQKFKRDPACERAPAESRPVLSGRNRGGKLFFRDEGAQRKPSRNWLCNGNNIRRDTESLEGEDRSRS